MDDAMRLLLRLLCIAASTSIWSLPVEAVGTEQFGDPPRVTVSLVLLHAPSSVETTTDLTSLGAVITHQSQLIPGATVFLEAWCQTPGPNGITTAVLDLSYATTFFDTSIAQIVLAPQWDLLPYDVSVDDATGLVDDFGGNNFAGLGVAPEWAKIGAVELDVTIASPGPAVLCSHFAGGILNFAIRSEGAVHPDDVLYGCFMAGCGVDADCNDGDACTNDSCESGVGCLHVPVTCDNGLHCDGTESCDPDLGCQPGTPPELNDNVACTVDTCDEDNDVIVHTPDNALCDDGLFCDGAETCDAKLDCQSGAPLELNDNVACTVDTCDEDNDVIVHTPDNGLCDNTLFCDGAETCDAELGCQTGAPPELNDNVACTVDTCDEDNDVIVHAADNALCDDGLFCDGAETCDAKLDCQSGIAPCVDPERPICDEDVDLCVECLEIGDSDGDGRVDLEDLVVFFNCITGPVGVPDPPGLPSECRCLDADDDDDIDLADFAAYQRNFTGT